MVAYDVGANVGLMSMVMAAYGAAVYLFEPSPKVYPRLLWNLRNNPELQIQPNNAGVSDLEGEAHLTDNGTCSRVSDHGDEIHLIRLDDFVYRDGHPVPSVVKIDVEGHGHKVLAGMSRILSTAPILCMEMHNAAEEEALDRVKFTYQLLAQQLDDGIKLLEGNYPYRVICMPAVNN